MATKVTLHQVTPGAEPGSFHVNATIETGTGTRAGSEFVAGLQPDATEEAIAQAVADLYTV